jgi:hypothetical protein
MKSGRSQNEKRRTGSLEKSHQACCGVKGHAAPQQLMLEIIRESKHQPRRFARKGRRADSL